MGENLYTSEVFSFTKNKAYLIGVSKDYLGPDDHVLVIDDFLANGRALIGLKDILDQAGSTLEGIGIVIEKGFQPGGALIRGMGIHLESLAIVESMKTARSYLHHRTVRKGAGLPALFRNIKIFWRNQK